MSSLLIPGLCGLAVAAVIWLAAMQAIVSRNFHPDGTRKTEPRVSNATSPEIQYHNSAIYRDFEFFFKITLAVLGGLAYLATSPNQGNKEVNILLIRMGGTLYLFCGALFSTFILLHQKSKVERWLDSAQQRNPLTWQECWMVGAIAAISAAVCFGFAPQLVAVLARSP